MVTIDSFGVRPAGLAGKTGSPHAAYAAAAQHKRRIAAATEVSVDQGFS